MEWIMHVLVPIGTPAARAAWIGIKGDAASREIMIAGGTWHEMENLIPEAEGDEFAHVGALLS